MASTTLMRRASAYALTFALVFSTVPPVGAAESVFGTIQVSGPAWVASTSADWSRLSSTRPLVAGDRLKTGSDGYLLADLGDSGVVGLYGDAEVNTVDHGAGPIIDVLKGKVAFHLSPDSKLKLQADGAGIGGQTAAADGYVEYGSDGIPVVVVEEGSLMVQVAGVDRELSRGQRMVLTSDGTAEPIQMAASNGETDDTKKAGAAATTTGKSGTYAGLSVAGWTAVGIVAAAVGGAFAVSSLSDDDDDGPGS